MAKIKFQTKPHMKSINFWLFQIIEHKNLYKTTFKGIDFFTFSCEPWEFLYFYQIQQVSDFYYTLQNITIYFVRIRSLMFKGKVLL